MSKLLPVTKQVSDYTEQELEQFYEQIAPTIERFRRIKRYLFRFLFPTGVAFVINSVAVGILASRQERPEFMFRFLQCTLIFLFLLFLASALLGAFLMYYLDRIECPACHNRVASSPIDYCPECGSDQVEEMPANCTRPLFVRFEGNRLECNACGKKLFITRGHGGGKSYWIRYCTHCGVFLDEKGF